MNETIVYWRYLPINHPKKISHDKIREAIIHAATEWNKAFENLVQFKEGNGELQIYIAFDEKIDKNKTPNRIGECRVYSNPRKWEISFDMRNKWNVGGWRKWIGIGNDLRSTALHEFGHIMQLPHSTDPEDIMYPDYNEKIQLDSKEIKLYRDFFISREDN